VIKLNINTSGIASGRVIEENGKVTNVVDMVLSAFYVPPVANLSQNIEAYAPRSGRLIAEDGKVYNAVDLLRAVLNGAGVSHTGSTLVTSEGYALVTSEGFELVTKGEL
jgi:hypothetical protein